MSTTSYCVAENENMQNLYVGTILMFTLYRIAEYMVYQTVLLYREIVELFSWISGT